MSVYMNKSIDEEIELKNTETETENMEYENKHEVEDSNSGMNKVGCGIVYTNKSIEERN